jgi:hypothetical protein
MSDNTQARLESESAQQTVDTLPLAEIRPDFSQPRHLLPEDLTTAVAAGEISPQQAATTWLERAATAPTDAGLLRNVRELKRLADSIEQHGQINPISVRELTAAEQGSGGAKYLIVTGERRYWACIYLLINNKQIHEGTSITSPEQIKVTLTAAGVSVKAHQMIENLMRENINAVERARGMWALRYELSGVNYSSPPPEIASPNEVNAGSPLLEGEDDNVEVNDSSPELAPWVKVEETLGISKRYRIFVTSVLNLCTEAQDLVNKHNLSEMTIRPIVQKLKHRPDLQVKALNQLVDWLAENEADNGPGRAIVASVKGLVEELLAEELAIEEKETEREALPRKKRAVSSEPAVRFRDKVRQTLDFLNRLKKNDRTNLHKALSQKDYSDVVLDLRSLRQQIDEFLLSADSAPIAESPEEIH